MGRIRTGGQCNGKSKQNIMTDDPRQDKVRCFHVMCSLVVLSCLVILSCLVVVLGMRVFRSFAEKCSMAA